jgi:hypothetical protein
MAILVAGLEELRVLWSKGREEEVVWMGYTIRWDRE